MQYNGLAWFTALLALLALLVAGRILFNRHWLLGWLRGTFGMACLVLAGMVALVARDLLLYAPLPDGKPLATLNFSAIGDQQFSVTLVVGAQEQEVALNGDLWQLDTRLLYMQGLATLIGLESGYRLEKLSGRYLAIEQQDLARTTDVSLVEPVLGVDIWRWLRMVQHQAYWLDADMVRSAPMPMADGAIFAVRLAPSGLVAQPFNLTAQQVMKGWH